MEKPLYAKIIKWITWALLAVSVIILIVAAAGNFSDGAVNTLLYWAYAMLGLALVAVVCVGIVVLAKQNPKGLVKIGIVLVAAVVICALVYVTAKGAPAVGYNGPAVTQSTLKLTDTILNLTYLVGGAAILAIIAGEVISGILNKKA